MIPPNNTNTYANTPLEDTSHVLAYILPCILVTLLCTEELPKPNLAISSVN